MSLNHTSSLESLFHGLEFIPDDNVVHRPNNQSGTVQKNVNDIHQGAQSLTSTSSILIYFVLFFMRIAVNVIVNVNVDMLHDRYRQCMSNSRSSCATS